MLAFVAVCLLLSVLAYRDRETEGRMCLLLSCEWWGGENFSLSLCIYFLSQAAGKGESEVGSLFAPTSKQSAPPPFSTPLPSKGRVGVRRGGLGSNLRPVTAEEKKQGLALLLYSIGYRGREV